MKTFLKTIAILTVVICFGACSDNNENYSTDTLEVTPNNISGCWMLTKFNGMELPEGTYCYIKYIRSGKEFEIYENTNSMYPRIITGKYSIDTDRKKGSILSGVYDYGNGEWNNKYIVVELLENFMVLQADTEEGEVCCYERCDGIPTDILEQLPE